MSDSKSVFNVYREKIDDHEMMMGPDRGKLAVALDLLTDALIVAGQHGIYCRNRKSPEKPSQDMQNIMNGLQHSKELLQAVLEQLRRPAGPASR